MKEDIVINEIYKEISAYYKSQSVKELINLYIKIMRCNSINNELSGIEERQFNSLCKIFDEDVPFSEIKLCLSNVLKVEAMLKKILIFVNEDHYIKLKSNRAGLSKLINILGLNPDNLRLDISNPLDYVNDPNYMNYILHAYNLRNSEAHTYENWNRKQVFDNLDSVIITCLRAIEISKNIIIQNLRKQELSCNLNIDTYLNSLIEEFKNRIAKFVHIRGKENFSVLGSYVVERIDEDNELQQRKGTVEELRDKAIPEKRMMIWGEAGMGKSTTLEYLTYIDAKKCIYDNYNSIPILILLGLLPDSSYTIKQFICDKLNIGMDLCDSLLYMGKINLFIDGLNEIPSGQHTNMKTLRLREIRQLIKSYPKTFIIMTNRPQRNKRF